MQNIHGNMTQTFVKLKGLKEGAKYKETKSGVIYSTGALKEFGIPIKEQLGSYNSYAWHLVLCE